MTSKTKTTCPNCQKTLRLSIEKVGREVRCPACRSKFTVASVGFGSDESLAPSMEALQTQQIVDAALQTQGNSSSEQGEDQASIGAIGRFQLKSILGHGGFGKVFRAYDPVLDREVALKMPRFDDANESKIKRFIKEGKSAARLRHPNIVAVFESGETNGQYFIASEYVDGVPLSERIAQNRPNYVHSANWVRLLAEALTYAHGEGIVHRDIKPENIMVDGKERPQIMDFGLAKRIDEDSSMTADGSLLGTPAYMSPEQARGEQSEVGPASDQYSLGVVLYELLTGIRPFSGAPHAVIAQVVSDEPAAPCSINSKIPKDLEAICLRAMHKDPAHRYADATAFGDDLNRWIKGEPVAARPIGLSERLGRWCRREPKTAALVGLVFLLTLIGGSAVTWQWRRAEANRQTAEANQEAALLQQQLAESNLKTANEQRKLAEANLTEAERQRVRAETNFAEAQKQRLRAEASLAEVEKQRQLTQTAQAGEQREATKAASAADLARKNLYISRLTQAETILRTKGSAEANVLLDSCAEDLRNWEWYYLKKLCGGSIVSLATMPDRIYQVAISPYNNSSYGGNYIAVAGEKYLHFYNFNQEGVLEQRTLKRSDIGSSPKLLVVSSSGNLAANFSSVIRYWVQGNDNDPKLLRRSTGISEICFDNSWNLAIAEGNAITLWDLVNGFRGATLNSDSQVNCMDFHKNGNLLATGHSDSTIKIWDVKDGKGSPATQKAKLLKTLNNHENPVYGLSFCGDDSFCSYSSNNDSGEDVEVKTWNSETGDEKNTFGIKSSGYNGNLNIDFSPSGDKVVSYEKQGILQLWDTTSGEKIRAVQITNSEYYRPSFVRFAGSKRVLYAIRSTLYAWDMAQSGFVTKRLKNVYDFSMSADGLHVASFNRVIRRTNPPGFYEIKLWNLLTDQVSFSLSLNPKNLVRAIALSPDGLQLAVSHIKSNSLAVSKIKTKSSTIQIWDVNQEKEILSIDTGTDFANKLSLYQEGNKIVAQRTSGKITIWNAITGEVIRDLEGNRNAAFTADGTRIATLDKDAKTILIIDSETGDLLHSLKGHTNNISALTLSQDGKFLASGTPYGSMKIWDTTTGNEHTSIKLRGRVDSLSFSPDAQRLVVSSKFDSRDTLSLWDSKSGVQLLDLSQYVRGPIYSMGRTLFGLKGNKVAAKFSGDLFIWEIPEFKKKVPQKSGQASE